MMPNFKSESFGGGDQSWLGSAHGIANCRTEKLKVSGFTKGTHYPNGYIPSGTPVAKVVPLVRRVNRTAIGSLAGQLDLSGDWSGCGH